MNNIASSCGLSGARSVPVLSPSQAMNCPASCSHQRYDDVDQYTMVPSTLFASAAQSALLPPTKSQLAQLTAVNGAMVTSLSKGRKKGGKNLGKKFTGKVFDISGARPMPNLTTPLQTYTITAEAYSTAFTTSATVPTYFGTNFTLSLFQAYGSYTSLFDEYLIEEIECWLECTVAPSSTVASAQLFSAVDFDDGNTPGAINTVLGKQGCLSSEVTSGHYHRWRPHVALAAYSGAFTSYSNIDSCWIDCASPAVQHYGLKACCPTADGVVRTINLTTRAKISFRGAAI